MQNNYNISVIIPNYNRCDKLIAAIKSVLGQTYEVHEIIVCDDGSTDDSKKSVLALNHSKLIWLDCGRNGRPAVPRNMGIRQSKGNWLAFLDNDDQWLPEKIEKQINILEGTGLNVVCSNASRIVNSKTEGPYSSLKLDQVLNFYNLAASNSVICSSVLAKKEVLAKYGLFPEEPELKALEDYTLWLKMSADNDIFYTAERLVNYTDESNTSIRKDSLSTQQQLRLIFNHIRKWQKTNERLCPRFMLLVLEHIFVLKFLSKGQRFFYNLFKF